MSQIDWGKLVQQNRVKAPGIPWSEAELKAIYQDGVSPDDVRNGILEKSETTRERNTLEEKTKEELVVIAKDLGLTFDESVVSRGDLILEIKAVTRKQEADGTEPADENEAEQEQDAENGPDDND